MTASLEQADEHVRDAMAGDDMPPNKGNDLRSRTKERASARTRYVEVASQLMSEIAEGSYEIGAKLPTEAQLCERFRVSRSTVRQALGEIEQAGLVERRQGSGTTLVAREPVLRYVLSLTSEADILRYAAETVLELGGPDDAVPPAEARRLHLGHPARWRRWEGIRREKPGGLAIGLTSVFLRSAYADVIKRLDKQSRQAIFEAVTTRYGLTLTHIDQAITATVLDEREAGLLNGDPGAPAIVIVRRYNTDIGLIEVSETVHPADRFRYEIRFDREAREPKRAAGA